MNRSRSGYVYIVLCAVIFSTMEVMLNTSFMRFMMAGGRNRRAAIGGFVS